VSAKDLREDVVSGLSHEEMQILGGEIRVKETEQTGERKLPWLVDIFLYPATTSGMIHVAVFLIAPILIDLLYRFVLSHAGPYGALLSFILYMFLIVYACRYFSDCVRDSAAGGVRAPEILGSTFGKDEMLEQYITMLACYAFFFGPVTFYRGYIHFSNAQVNNAIFWPLLAYGLFFFPMGILAVVMFDSINGLNPILLICSIVSTFFQYCGLLFFIAALCVLRIQILTLSIRQRWGTFAKVVPNLVLIWLLFVAAHIIGRFYWRYQEKLNWEA
jgi:hypothetical protein